MTTVVLRHLPEWASSTDVEECCSNFGVVERVQCGQGESNCDLHFHRGDLYFQVLVTFTSWANASACVNGEDFVRSFFGEGAVTVRHSPAESDEAGPPNPNLGEEGLAPLKALLAGLPHDQICYNDIHNLMKLNLRDLPKWGDSEVRKADIALAKAHGLLKCIRACIYSITVKKSNTSGAVHQPQGTSIPQGGEEGLERLEV